MINTEQQLADGKLQEKCNNINEAIEIYLAIANENIHDLRAYDRLLVLYRKKKDYENEVSLILRALFVVMVLGNKDIDIDDIHKEWEIIIDDIINRNIVQTDCERVTNMDIDLRLKFAEYIERYYSLNLLLEKRKTKELKKVLSEQNIHSPATLHCEIEVSNKEGVIVEEIGCPSLEVKPMHSTHNYKKYAIYVPLLLLSIWLLIAYPWLIICIAIILLIGWTSISGDTGNVRGHYKKNGTYVNNYKRRTNKKR